MSGFSGIHWIIRNDRQRSNLLAHLGDLPFPYAVKVGPVMSPKSTRQVRYAHSLCNALAAHVGCSPETAKRDAKAEYGVVKVSTSVLTGDRTVRLISFADYSRDEMTAFLTAMEAFLSEKGIDFEWSREI